MRSRPVGLLILACIVAGCARGGETRPPAVAGSFYERMPVALQSQVDHLLTGATAASRTGSLVAAVAPHAGYVFSGRCAAHLYSLIASGQFKRVVILAPSHHVAFQGIALPAPDESAYATPLGDVEIDQTACEALGRKPGFVRIAGVDAREHAVEVQLPFLQRTARQFKLIPLICGRLEPAAVERAGKILGSMVGRDTLLIASSDFTHYGPQYGFVPFSESVPEHLREWLKLSAEKIAVLDVAGFDRHCRATDDTICGETPVRILMTALKTSGMGVAGRVLNLAASGDTVGRYDNSVSYAAIGFFAAEPAGASGEMRSEVAQNPGKEVTVKEHRSGDWSPELTEAERNTLFAIARDTLKWCVEGSKGRFPFDPYRITPVLEKDVATFVTLKIHGDLRGCIGSLAPVEPLYRSVHNNAINAALRDPRFTPVRAEELGRITIDVSILSPIRDIGSYKEFKLGKQGIIIEKGMRRAVYLPEVAVEQGWTVEETLSSLSMKAGLPPDAWREGARFKVFESAVLSE